MSGEELGPTKTGRTRRLTLGRSTVALWESTANGWRERLPDGVQLGEWVFSAEPTHHIRLRVAASGA